VKMDGNLTDRQLIEMIDHSYNLVLAGLPKKLQEQIRALQG
jgi:predicted DNA-binding protein (MmcQ/YjbR family)